jgi:hypothetical protein
LNRRKVVDDLRVREVATEEVYRVIHGHQEGSGSAYIQLYEKQHVMQPGRLPPEPPELRSWNGQFEVEELAGFS